MAWPGPGRERPARRIRMGWDADDIGQSARHGVRHYAIDLGGLPILLADTGKIFALDKYDRYSSNGDFVALLAASRVILVWVAEITAQ